MPASSTLGQISGANKTGAEHGCMYMNASRLQFKMLVQIELKSKMMKERGPLQTRYVKLCEIIRFSIKNRGSLTLIDYE